ncbi:hypothetical protein H5T87_04740 [bacterium]|nr:hypothetical protein [bacterium]
MKTLIKCAIISLAFSFLLRGADLPTRVRDRWDFRYKGFVIGAWWGPSANEAELKFYKEAGFNVVMIGRYMQLNDYADIEKCLKELDLAKKYGLWVMFDTYTKNEHPWGGKAWSEPYDHPLHHAASLEELVWLYEKVGKHPSLLGFMIGDDQGEVSPRTSACTNFLFRQPKPHLMPWLCGWIPPRNLAEHNNPIANPQIYPTLYEWNLSADMLAIRYISAYASWTSECRKYGIMFWPMFNVAPPPGTDYLPSDSLTRFPAYLALVFGSDGIWYFCYNGGSLQRYGEYSSEEEVRKALTPLYPVVKKANNRIAQWGDKIIGRDCSAIYITAFEGNEEIKRVEGLRKPGKKELIEEMDKELIAGVLTKKGENPLVMVVDCRVSKNWGDIPPREVLLKFSPDVREIKVLEGMKTLSVRGNTVKIRLEAGGGQMLEIVK